MKCGEEKIPPKNSFFEKLDGFFLSDRGLEHVTVAGYANKSKCQFSLSVNFKNLIVLELRKLRIVLKSTICRGVHREPFPIAETFLKALRFLITREYPFREGYIVKQSSYTTTQNGRGIGKGVVARRHFFPGEILGYFVGNEINLVQCELEREGNNATFILELSHQTFLDCQYAASTGLCEMSMVNDPKGLRNSLTNKIAEANTFLKKKNGALHLVTFVPVSPGEEFFFDYGEDYCLDKPSYVEELSLSKVNLEGRLNEKCIPQSFLRTVDGTGFQYQYQFQRYLQVV